MNLTDCTRTPLHRVQEMIRSEAARHGYAITQAELIGLIPEQALIDAARWYLQLDLFQDDQILERKLHAAEAQDELIPQAFLDAVASGEPTPGGGSVAALAGGLGAALAAMVARATMGKKKYAEVEDQMQNVAATSDALRADLTNAISEDSAAFEKVLAAYRLSKEDANRLAAIQAAMQYAADVPLRTAQLAIRALEQIQIVAAQGNTNAASDAAAGAHMALACLEAAALNVLINVQSIEDETISSRLREDIHALRTQGRALVGEILAMVESRAGLT
jgi:glutamate formiminotransferase/formiminotetrahydrofolate cyclodeaminase